MVCSDGSEMKCQVASPKVSTHSMNYRRRCGEGGERSDAVISASVVRNRDVRPVTTFPTVGLSLVCLLHHTTVVPFPVDEYSVALTAVTFVALVYPVPTYVVLSCFY